MAWFVYILDCNHSYLYTGITNNLSRRITEHKSGRGAKFTRRFKDKLHCVYHLEVKDQSLALRLELVIKKLTHEQKQNLVESQPGYSELIDFLRLKT